MEKKLLLVYNPVSGKNQIKESLSKIIDTFTKAGYSVSVHPTQARKDGFEYIKNNVAEYDVLSVCGGDGMLNELANALMSVPRDKRKPVVILPGGSTNDFANTLGLSGNLKKDCEKINADLLPCDLGQFNGDNFIYVAAFGVFTSVSYDTSQELKNKLGHLAYVVSGMKELTSIKGFKVKVSYDDNVIEDEFIFGSVTNSLQIGGFKTIKHPEFSLNDGLFEVLLVKDPKTAMGYQTVVAGLLSNNLKSDYFVTFKTSKVTFESEEKISWTLDGEYGGDTDKAEINIIEKAFDVML